MLTQDILSRSEKGGSYAMRGMAASAIAATVLALAGCGGNGRPGTGAQQDIPAAFDTAARALSAQGYSLANCVAIADDKEKLACYAGLGFKDKKRCLESRGTGRRLGHNEREALADHGAKSGRERQLPGHSHVDVGFAPQRGADGVP